MTGRDTEAYTTTGTSGKPNYTIQMVDKYTCYRNIEKSV